MARRIWLSSTLMLTAAIIEGGEGEYRLCRVEAVKRATNAEALARHANKDFVLGRDSGDEGVIPSDLNDWALFEPA